MSSGFWSNTIWFVLLGITTIVEIVVIIAKAKNRKLVIALLFTMSGIVFTYEMVILNFLKAYNYHPMLIPDSILDENIAGNLFSQLSVTATALLIAVLNLKNYWYLIFAVIYGIVEEIFLKLGIYTHNWYQTWMTVVGLILLFWITKKIYKFCLEKNAEGFSRYFFIFIGLFALYMNLMWPLKLMGIFNAKILILPDAIMNLNLIAMLDYAFLSIIIMIVYYLKIELKWRVLVISALYIAFYIVKKLNIEYFAEGWLTFATITIKIFGMYLFVVILDKLYDPV